MTDAIDLHRVAPGTSVDLAAIDPVNGMEAPGDRDATEAVTRELAGRLADQQSMLWATKARKVLVVLQGIDTAGKGGTVKHVFGAVNPAGLRVVPFDAPSDDELARDYLWRVHAEVPRVGEIGVFDRSHYEDVLAVRVLELVPEARWRKRYEHIRAFEQLLVDEGTTVVKLLLHISKAEQAKRLRARLDDPTKRWKLKLGDLDARAQWDDYQRAFAEAIEETTTESAPWYVIPADKKWYRNWAVATIMTAHLDAMGLTWPEPEEDLSGVVID